MSATFNGDLNRSVGTSLRNSFSRFTPASDTTPPWSNSDSDKFPRASSTILPRGIFTLNARSSRNTMSRKSIDSAPRSSISDASSFIFSTSQPSASAIVSATLGKMALISSLFMLWMLMCSLHFKSTVHVQDFARDIIGVRRTQEPDRMGHVRRPADPAQQNPGLDLIAGHFADGAGHFGFDDAWGDGVDGNITRGQFHREGFGKRVNGPFAGGVIGLATPAFLAGDGTDIDDFAAAFRNHVRHDSAGHVESRGGMRIGSGVHVIVPHCACR